MKNRILVLFVGLLLLLIGHLHAQPSEQSVRVIVAGSQGGALSIITASLDSRVKYLAAFFPALSDVTGYLHRRAGGWPHMFNKNNAVFYNKKENIEACGYYDVVKFCTSRKSARYV